jgi:hypothetical protein
MPRLPDAAEIAYMEAHIDDTLVPNIIACTVICGAASVLFIILRLIARMLTKASLQTSDWLILFAWVSLSNCRNADDNSSNVINNWEAMGTEKCINSQPRRVVS